MIRDGIIEYLKELKPILKQKGIEKIALFGSFAKKEANIYSDIDIAISKHSNFFDKFSAYDYFEIIDDLKNSIKKKYKRDVDIYDLNSNSSFLKEIEKELIYV